MLVKKDVFLRQKMANFQKIEVSTEIFTQILLNSITYHLKTLLNNKNITQHTKNRQFVICHNALSLSPTVRRWRAISFTLEISEKSSYFLALGYSNHSIGNVGTYLNSTWFYDTGLTFLSSFFAHKLE